MDRAEEGRPIVVVGAGGHAKVVIELLRVNGWSVVACTDADTTPRTVLGVPVVGDDEQLAPMRAQGVDAAFVALGGNALRERVGVRLVRLGFACPSVVSPHAVISSSAILGDGIAIMPGVVVNADSTIGDFAIINTGASVDHDNSIGQAAHVAPGCSLAGCVSVGVRSFLGAGTTIIPNIDIGQDSIIGAGSVVVRNLPDGVKAYGAPARIRAG